MTTEDTITIPASEYAELVRDQKAMRESIHDANEGKCAGNDFDGCPLEHLVGAGDAWLADLAGAYDRRTKAKP